MKLNYEQICEILPHRYPFLFIDRVEECEPGVYARATKCVSGGEAYFQGHFPQTPVMPGVLILEAMAQTGAVVVLSKPENKGKLALFGGIKSARFRRQIVPGDSLNLECRITKQRGTVGIGEAKATVDGETVCSAELTFAIVEPKDGN